MKNLKVLFVFLILSSFLFANSMQIKNLNDRNITINKNSFKILEFEKMISKIKVSDSKKLELGFIDSDKKPLQIVKVLAKDIGNGNILITFIDSSSIHIDINIVENLSIVLDIAQAIAPNLNIKQANGKIILRGSIDNKKTKDKIINLFSKSGIDIEKDLVDLITLENPPKMIKIKMYAVEINNTEGLDLKNNWMVSSKNYMTVQNPDGTYYNRSLNSNSADYKVTDYTTSTNSDGTSIVNPSAIDIVPGSAIDQANNQRMLELETTLNSVMTNAVSLSGGLSGFTNYLGKYFNAGLVLQYLSTKGVANILDETTLITLENKDATFHAGGTIRVKTQTSTSEGIPVSGTEVIDYGLKLDFKAKNIMQNEYIDLEIDTRSTQIDWSNQVDGIPGFLEKKIKTNVLAKNKNTIILGGLINNENSYDMDKIPLLGDMPILGFLFRSKSFREGKSELVFFITPEVIDPAINDQNLEFTKKRTQMLDTSKYRDKDNIFEAKKDNTKENNKNEDISFLDQLFNSEITKEEQESRHKENVNKILGN